MVNIAIIGAGLSGLTAANMLKSHANVTIFEKSRGVGGRMATRRAEPYFFDHGTQFFKVKDNNFAKFIEPMVANGVIQIWDALFVEFSNAKIVQKRKWNETHPHYVGAPNMNSIAKYLSQELNINLGVRVQVIKKNKDKWQLEDDVGNLLGEYDWIISTIPSEQASALVPSWISFFTKLKSIKMKSCFSLMLGFENKLSLGFDAALVHDANISWISVNNSKPKRADTSCLLIHSTNKWSDKHIADDHTWVLEYLCQQTSEIVGYDLSHAHHKALHSWSFANIEKQTGATHLLDAAQNIAVCGDWLIQGRVEAAFLSAFEMVNHIVKALNGAKKHV